MADKQGESKYAQKVRAGNRMYGPCGYGPYTPSSEEAVQRAIADTKFWVGRLRATLGRDAGNEPITLEMIRAAKEAAKLRAA